MDAPAVAVKVCCNEVEKAWLQLVPVAVYEERGHAAVHRTTHAALVRQAPPQERHALVRGQPATAAAAAAAAAAKTAAFVASVATRADAKEKEYAGGRERAHGLVPREERLAERQRRHVSRAAARQQRRRHAHKLRGVVRVELRQVPSGQGGAKRDRGGKGFQDARPSGSGNGWWRAARSMRSRAYSYPLLPEGVAQLVAVVCEGVGRVCAEAEE